MGVFTFVEMKLAHIVNPVKVADTNQLYVAQPITFESIRVAKQFAENQQSVELFAVGYSEDIEIVPAYFTVLPNLSRSVLDIFQFSPPRKYPLITDVLSSLYNNTDADYLIFTNMDIALMPQFYLAVKELLTDGADVLLINRRGISTSYASVKQLPLMYSDFGKPHPGFDCFVFKRDLFPQLILENVCVGVSFSEVALVHNFIAFAKQLKLVDNLHLTFHLGAEVMPPLLPQYYKHNRNEYEQKIYPRLKPHLNISKYPYATLPLHKRLAKWMLNPVFRTHQVAEMEGKSFLRRWKYKIDGWRFEWLNRIR